MAARRTTLTNENKSHLMLHVAVDSISVSTSGGREEGEHRPRSEACTDLLHSMLEELGSKTSTLSCNDCIVRRRLRASFTSTILLRPEHRAHECKRMQATRGLTSLRPTARVEVEKL